MFEISLDPGAVLLKKAVAPFIEMNFNLGIISISEDDVTLISASNGNPMLQAPPVVLALRMQPSFFQTFGCTESLWLCLDLTQFYNILFQATDTDFLGLYGDSARDHIDTILLSTRTLVNQIPVLSRYLGLMNVPVFQEEYQEIVGIPSERFKDLVMDLCHFGVTVSARVTDTQVTISIGNKEVVLVTELDQCIIGGVVGEDPVTLEFSIHYTSAILNASVISNMVWLLRQSNGSSVMLKFPVGALGNLMFYFGSEANSIQNVF